MKIKNTGKFLEILLIYCEKKTRAKAKKSLLWNMNLILDNFSNPEVGF